MRGNAFHEIGEELVGKGYDQVWRISRSINVLDYYHRGTHRLSKKLFSRIIFINRLKISLISLNLTFPSRLKCVQQIKIKAKLGCSNLHAKINFGNS